MDFFCVAINMLSEAYEGSKDCTVLSCSVVSDSLRPHGLYPTRLLCPWDSPGKNTGEGCHPFLQGIFPTQGSKHSSPTLQMDSLPSEPPGKPKGSITAAYLE